MQGKLFFKAIKKAGIPKGLLLVIAILSFNSSQAQRFADRLYFGGNFGLQFGTITIVDISPLVGYRITKELSGGLGATYIYYKYQTVKTDLYGGRLFGRYAFTENIFAHSEYELLSGEIYDLRDNKVKRVLVPAVLVGGGYFMPFGDNSGLGIMLLYNLNQNIYSFYSNPIIRIGFTAGF